MSKKFAVIGIFALIVAIGLVAKYARTAPAPQRSASSASPSFLTYRDDKLGFTVRYDPSLISFEENFSVTPVARPWLCLPPGHLPQEDKAMKFFAEEHLAPQPIPTENCREPSFIEFVNYSSPKGVQTIFPTTQGTSVVVLRSQTSAANAFSGKRGSRDTYRIFVEAPRYAQKKAWALDLYLVPRKGTLLCNDQVCDIGEETPDSLSYCKSDCPNGKDWNVILKKTFSTLEFL